MRWTKKKMSSGKLSCGCNVREKPTPITNGLNFTSVDDANSLIKDDCHIAIIGDEASGKTTFI